MRDLNAIPEDIRAAVRNNGGGHVNHSMYWKIMKPKGGGDPNGPVAEAIKKTFGSFKDFQTKFNDAGAKQFGSGWAWLAGKSNGEVVVMSTPNQDNPISQGLYPDHGQRCVGARLLLEVQQPPAGIFAGVVERSELGRDQPALRSVRVVPRAGHGAAVRERVWSRATRPRGFTKRSVRNTTKICTSVPAGTFCSYDDVCTIMYEVM